VQKNRPTCKKITQRAKNRPTCQKIAQRAKKSPNVQKIAQRAKNRPFWSHCRVTTAFDPSIVLMNKKSDIRDDQGDQMSS
jgi:hypothetical protein